MEKEKRWRERTSHRRENYGALARKPAHEVSTSHRREDAMGGG